MAVKPTNNPRRLSENRKIQMIKDKYFCKIFFGFIIFLVSLPTLSEPKIETKFSFYNIYPKTKVDIKRELHERTPIMLNGKKFRGDTQWYVNWRFKWKRKNGSCQIYSVNTDLSVQYTMPKIPNDFPVDSSIRDAFEKYYHALLKHEQGHKNSGLYAARDIEKELLSLGAFKNCQRLEKIANKKGKSIIEKYSKRDNEYDQRTAHGRSEGVNIDLYIN